VVGDSALAQQREGKNTPASASLGRELAIANLALVALSSSLLFQLGSPLQNFSSLHESLLETHTTHGLIRALSRSARGQGCCRRHLHYLASGTVAGTVILLKDAGWKESDVPALLGSLDEDFLPDVDLDHGNLNYTVVLGEVLGNYEAEKK
jgi:hypothetical protein